MRKVLRILNIIYMAIAVAAIIVYFTVPFVNLEANVVINKTEITTLINKVPGGEKLKESDLFKENEQVEVSIRLNVTPTEVFKAASGDRVETINTYFIYPKIQDVINALRDQVNRASVAILRYAAKDTINNQVDKYREDQPINQEKVEEAADKILDSILEENATVESVSETIYEEVVNILDDAGIEHGDLTQEQIEEKLEEVLDEYGLVNEDGTLKDPEDVAGALLYDLITQYDIFGSEGSGIGEEGDLTSSSSTEPKPAIHRANTPSNELTVEEKAAKVESVLTEQIKTRLQGQFITISSGAYVGMLILFIIFIVTWAFLFIFTLIRTCRPKKCYTFFGPIFWAVGAVQIALGIGLMIASNAAGNIVNYLGGVITKSGTFLSIFQEIHISASASALIPGILVLCCIPLTIVYHIYKKKVKKQIKIDKAVDKKIAEMQGSQM